MTKKSLNFIMYFFVRRQGRETFPACLHRSAIRKSVALYSI